MPTINNIPCDELADILINYFKFTLPSCVYEVNPIINSLSDQVKEILIELEVDKGAYITPAHYILVPMNEIGFAYIRETAYHLLALIQAPYESSETQLFI